MVDLVKSCINYWPTKCKVIGCVCVCVCVCVSNPGKIYRRLEVWQ